MIRRFVAAAPKGPSGKLRHNALAPLYRSLPDRTVAAIQVRAQVLLGPVAGRMAGNPIPLPASPAQAQDGAAPRGPEPPRRPGPTHRPAQKRPCLCCGRAFWSAGPGNRLCTECRKRSVSPYAP